MKNNSEIRKTNERITPFEIYDCEDGNYGLSLPFTFLDGEYENYGQAAFDHYAEQVGEPAKRDSMHTHGNGYEWEKVFAAAFENDDGLSKIEFDSEAGGFYCYSPDLAALSRMAVEFKRICDDSVRLDGLVARALSGTGQKTLSHEFLVDICKDFPDGGFKDMKLALPASYDEMIGAFKDAEIDQNIDTYSVELLYCRREYLWKPLDGQTPSLHELNTLAERLAGLEQYESDIFEGLCKMESSAPSVERLIKMTYSIGDCAALWDVRNDAALGRQSFDDDFFPQLADIPDKAAKYLDFAKIGKERREMEHGMYTGNGYIVNLAQPDTSPIENSSPEPAPRNGAGFSMPEDGQPTEQVDAQSDAQTFEQTM